MKTLKKYLRYFFYVYGIIFLPLAHIIYNDPFGVTGLHHDWLHERDFKYQIKTSCQYLTFLINFLIFLWILGNKEFWNSGIILKNYQGYYIYFIFVFMVLWDWLVVSKFFDWLFKDKK